jgi:hypothetical protein
MRSCPGTTTLRALTQNRGEIIHSDTKQMTGQDVAGAPTPWYAQFLVRPGGVEPPTALQSGAHDGYKPSALPVELWAPSRGIDAGYQHAHEVVRVVGFEPTASCVRGRHSRRAELHPVGAP